MSLKIIILGCLVAFANSVLRRLPRIAGGENALPGQYPYYVSLYHKYSLDYHPITFCGGAILNSQWIITAAFCVLSAPNATEILVKAGNIYYRNESETEQKSNVLAMFYHPNYSDLVGPHDIGLMKLETPLKFDKFVAPIDLPKAGAIPSGRSTLLGLGSLKNFIEVHFPNSLQTVDLTIISNDECLKSIENTIGEHAKDFDLVDEFRFCTGATKTNQGYCLHDTGDPLAVKDNGKNVLIGVATFGFATDCETPGLPSIYTRISAYNNWIQDTIDNN